jgi:hypothetical protein
MEGDIPIDSETFLVTDFVNLKIKSAQSFKCAHKYSVYTCAHKSECSYKYNYLYLYCVSKKSPEIS